MSRIGDAESREAIRNELDRNLFVEAGAGTGKTTALVGRLVQLIARPGRPLRMSEIVAITFTEKAAAEITLRLRKALEDKIRESDASESGRFVEALASIDDAYVGTIHGFARRILAEHPIEAGLPPAFELLDSVQNVTAFDDWWNDLIPVLLADPSLEDPWQALLDNELGTDCLRAFAAQLHEHWNLAENSALPCERPSDLEFDALIELLTDLSRTRETCLDEKDTLYTHLARLDEWIQNLTNARTTGQIMSALDWPFGTVGNKGATPKWPGPVKEVRDMVARINDSVPMLRSRFLLFAIGPILDSVRRAVVEQAVLRRLAGQLEFHDLLILAARLLAQNSNVAQDLHDRVKCLFVDEFQDTDPIQLEIVTRIACPEGTDVEDRLRRAPPGRLFFVGDPKQAIYRFRGADIRRYSLTKLALETGHVFLTHNFRSARSVIEWINGAFEGLFRTDNQAEYVGLVCPELLSPGDTPNVRVLGGPLADHSADEIRRVEAEQIALSIREAVDQEHGWKIPDKNSLTGIRNAEFRDITILFPTRTIVKELENALEDAEIPYRIDSKSEFFKTQEARDLVAILRAIDDPTDQISLVAALRTNAFAVNDRELLAFSKQGGVWDYRNPIAGRLGEPMATLKAWHGIKNQTRVGVLTEAIVRQRRLIEQAAAHPRARDAWRRLEIFQSLAEEFDRDKGGTLGQFLAEIEALERNGYQIRESIEVEPDDDAVTLMTIHAAKGLEFPITIVAGLGAANRSGDSVRVFWKETGPADPAQIEFRLRADPPIQSPGFANLFEDDKDLNRLENDRLLYVAATRAKHHLLIGCHHKDPKSAAGRLFGAIPQHLLFSHEPTGYLPEEKLPRTDEGAVLERASWISDRQKHFQQAAPPPRKAATALAQEMGKLDISDHWESEDEPDSDRTFGGAGVGLGRAVHAVLQRVNFGGPITEYESATAFHAELHETDADRVGLFVKRALRCGPLKRAAVAPHWREVFVSATVEGVLLEGFLDLLYRDERGAYHVIDYKTDSVRDATDVAKNLERYRYQAASYALALEANLGRAPSTFEFAFLALPNDNVFPIHDLQNAMAEVRDHLRNVR